MLWDELGDLFGYYGLRWCVAGDFDVVRSPDEKASHGRITRSMRCFNKFIGDSGLFDPPMDGGKFTWTNSRVATRIDRVLLPEDWIERFGNPR